MTSNWAPPTSIIQYAEPGFDDHHVSWINLDFTPLVIQTSRDLLHIAMQPKHDILDKTYFLKFSGFTFETLPDTISGIEMRLTMKRNGRISDETIQLCLGDNLLGDNLCTPNVDTIKLYGGENDTWNASVTPANLADLNFGVTMRFKSHPSWPHKTGAMVKTVELRVH
jgi:hypothetical protein